MQAITLTSDRQGDDFFLGRLKGQLLCDCPDAQVIDLAHNITLFSHTEVGFILQHSYRNFPAGTIHIIGVDAEESEQQNHLIVKTNEQYFIGADNGIFSLIFDETVNIQSIKNVSTPDLKFKGLPAMFKFVKLAQLIIADNSLKSIGKPVNNFKKMFTFSPAINGSSITGKVIYIDSYRNVITNISKDEFEEAANGRNFTLYIGSRQNVVKKISDSYTNLPIGQILAKFNSLNLLELALNKGPIADLMSLGKNTELRIDFHDK